MTTPPPTVRVPQGAPRADAPGGFQDLLENQRRALAREIHDDIGGALGAVHFDLAWIERHPGDPAAAAHLASAREALDQAMAAAQRVVQGLYPPDLDDGLVAALRGLARGFGKRYGIAVTFDVDGAWDAPLPAPVRLAAYRTVQEALSNVARHACCGAVAIASGQEAASLWLEVRDDGRGFGDPESPRNDDPDPRGASGFGLHGLAERAREAGGRFDVRSRPGHGTVARLTVPSGAPPHNTAP